MGKKKLQTISIVLLFIGAIGFLGLNAGSAIHIFLVLAFFSIATRVILEIKPFRKHMFRVFPSGKDQYFL
jgi:hypothetical protein